MRALAFLSFAPMVLLAPCALAKVSQAMTCGAPVLESRGVGHLCVRLTGGMRGSSLTVVRSGEATGVMTSLKAEEGGVAFEQVGMGRLHGETQPLDLTFIATEEVSEGSRKAKTLRDVDDRQWLAGCEEAPCDVRP